MKIKLFSFLFFLVTFVSCELGTKLTKDTKETVVTGTTAILVDETIFPIVEDVVAVFENEYKNAKINLIAKPEGEILRLLKDDKSKIAILARNLSRSELQYYSNKNIIPRITAFGEDAVVFIAHHSNDLEAISIDQFASKLKGTTSNWSPTIVFENPESSTLAFLKSELAIDTLDSKAVFSMKDSKELIRFVAANKNAVGIVNLDIETGEMNRETFFKAKEINSLAVPKLFITDDATKQLILYSVYGKKEKFGILNFKD